MRLSKVTKFRDRKIEGWLPEAETRGNRDCFFNGYRAPVLAGGRGECRLLFNVCRVAVFQDEKISGDWVYNNANTLNRTKLYT